MNHLLREALDYARLGYAIFPCRTGAKAPATVNGVKDATDDPVQLASFFADDTRNIALSCAELLVIDLDQAEHPWASREWPSGPVARTPRGGWHRFFRKPAGLRVQNWNGKLAPAVDLKTGGGYVLVAPSHVVNPEKGIDGIYTWIEPLISRQELPEVPDWLRGELERCQASPASALSTPSSAGRSNSDDSASVISRARQYLAQTPPAISGEGGHPATLWAARVVVRGFLLSDAAAWQLLLEWNATCSPPWSESELQHKLEEARTKPFEKPEGWLLVSDCWPTGGSVAVMGSTILTPPRPERPAPPHEWAYYGLAGEFVRRIEEHTEADPVAILGQFLTCFGNMIGSAPYTIVANSRHRCCLYTMLVGPTSSGRKGTSRSVVERLFGRDSTCLDEHWAKVRTKGGLSSAEGLINAVRDANSQIDDPGEPDKRLMVYEEEVASVFEQFRREGNTLSPLLRTNWDGQPVLSTLTRNPLQATNPHISLVGHITKTELMECLRHKEIRNGLANRIMFLDVLSPRDLPRGGNVPDRLIADLREQLNLAAGFAQNRQEVPRHPDCDPIVEAVYSTLKHVGDDVVGSLSARGSAIIWRLATIQALLNRSDSIRPPHLMAGIALWDYASRGLVHMFGNKTGNTLADDILELLASAGDGVTRKEMMDFTSRNKSSSQITTALTILRDSGRAKYEIRSGGGRPSEVWYLIPRQRSQNDHSRLMSLALEAMSGLPQEAPRNPGTVYLPPFAYVPPPEPGEVRADGKTVSASGEDQKPPPPPSAEAVFIVHTLRKGDRPLPEVEKTAKKAGLGSLAKALNKEIQVTRSIRGADCWIGLPTSIDLSRYPEIPEEPATLVDAVPEPEAPSSAVHPGDEQTKPKNGRRRK